MMADGFNLDAAWDRLQSARTLDDIVALLREFDARSERSRDYLRLKRDALSAMVDLCVDSPVTPSSLIIEFLLPDCVALGNSSTDASVGVGSLRKLLAKWLDFTVELNGNTERQQVINWLHGDLRKAPSQECLWTIGAIGYRTNELLASLRPLANEDETPLGDTALATLVSLGMPPETRQEVIQVLQRKLDSHGPRRGLLFAIQELVAPDLFGIVSKLISELNTEDATPLSFPFSTLTTLASKIAASDPVNSELQNETWALLRAHRSEATRSGDLASRCNAEAPLIDYANWLAGVYTDGASEHWRYIYYDRMAELVRPKAMQAWDNVGDELQAVLKHDATRNSGMSGQFLTSTAKLKAFAFETALCAGAPALIDWVEDAVGNEQNGHIAGSTLEIAACLRFPAIPGCVLELITKERDLYESEDTQDLVAHNGAVQFARSSGTQEAFDALANFGATYNGNTLLNLSEALVDVTLHRATQGDAQVVTKLVSNSLNASVAKRHREIAIDSLRSLAANNLLREDDAEGLLRLAADESLSEFSRCRVIEAVGLLNPALAESAIPFLTELAIANDGDAGWRAVEALIRQQTFSDDPGVICQKLSLVKSSSGWQFTNDDPPTEWKTYLIGLLYKSDAEGFAFLVSRLLRDAKADAVFQLLNSVEHHGVQTPPSVVDALVHRIYDRFNAGSVETILFDSLALLSMQRLVEEHWELKWADWLAEGRVAICNVLRYANVSEPLRGRAFALLAELALDGVYAVRRTAYRAIAALDTGAMISLWRLWADSSDVLLRKRAAEAIPWIPMFALSASEVSEVGLACDNERSVRDIAVESFAHRWERHWAGEYLELVTKATQPADAEMFAAYRYGRALTVLGDDDTVQQLKLHLRDSSLPANIRHWIQGLIKKIDKQWNKVSREWPEPWFNLSGVVEEVDGELILDNGRALDCSFSLWRMSRTSPSKLGKWGAVIRLLTEFNWGELWNVSTAEIKISGRNSAEVGVGIQTASSNNAHSLMIVSGRSEYPEQRDS